MISVIGAGHCGLYASYLLAKQGLEVTAFDKKRQIGYPVHCTGIVTHKIDDLIKLPAKTIANRVSNIELISANNSFSLRLKKPDYILDRPAFENHLFDLATKAGAKIMLDSCFVRQANGRIVIRSSKNPSVQEYPTSILIGADGPLSTIYDNLNPDIKRHYYKGIQARVNGKFEKDTYKVYLGSVCPDFFAWVVPESETVARLGLATKKNPKALFDNFLKKQAIRQTQILETWGGLIPTHNPQIRTQKGNNFLVGDAALQLKSSTGGGIIQGMIAADALGRSIIQGKNYEGEWRKHLATDLKAHLLIRNYLNRFTDADYDFLIEKIKDEKVAKILSAESRDSSFSLLMKLLFAKPSLGLFGLKKSLF